VPLATILSYLPELTVSDYGNCGSGIVPENFASIAAEVQRRLRASEKKAGKDAAPEDSSASSRTEQLHNAAPDSDCRM